MIHIVDGDLLESDCDVIIHQSNCMFGFGSGIAGQIKKKFPRAYDAFILDKREPLSKLGDFSFSSKRKPWIYNVYGQLEFGRVPGMKYTDYAALSLGIGKVLNVMKNVDPMNRMKIGLPYKIGCGLAGGDWDTVSALLEEASETYGKDLYLYRFDPEEVK